jgi:hypothetical protein
MKYILNYLEIFTGTGYNYFPFHKNLAAQDCVWLRHCATSHEFACCIADEIIDFSIDLILAATNGPSVDSVSSRNEY